MKKDLKSIVRRINELFITERKKYIIQNEDGTYRWLTASKKSKVSMLHDFLIETHLKQEKTYGIFSGSMITKFVTFDVDIPSHEIVHSIYNILNNVGVESKFIHTSWSGSKGYHIDIYFSKPIASLYIKKLYDYVIFELQKRDPEIKVKEVVELRPSPTQGLKLPLSINRKNKDPLINTCWYVDTNHYMQFIQSLDYILEIEQIDSDAILDIIKKLPITKSYYKPSNSTPKNGKKKDMYVDNETSHIDLSINSLKLLDENGLTSLGTRNESLCKLAIYYKELRLSKKQCEDRLIQWMDKQDAQFYKTSLHICYKEIKRIAHGVYNKNIPLRRGKTEVEFFKSELINLLRFERVELMTLFYLFVHSKRYADENGEFFMTYN